MSLRALSGELLSDGFSEWSEENEQELDDSRVISIPELAQESSGIQALLLEIIRRAAYDWVLYRDHHKLKPRKLAQEAQTWLFEECPGHPDWVERQRSDKEFTSFINICSMLDLDPDKVREHVRTITLRQILSTGRPPIYRRKPKKDKEELVISGSALFQEIQSWQDEIGFSTAAPITEPEEWEPTEPDAVDEPREIVRSPSVSIPVTRPRPQVVTDHVTIRYVHAIDALRSAFPDYYIDTAALVSSVLGAPATPVVRRVPMSQQTKHLFVQTVSFLQCHMPKESLGFLPWAAAG